MGSEPDGETEINSVLREWDVRIPTELRQMHAAMKRNSDNECCLFVDSCEPAFLEFASSQRRREQHVRADKRPD